MKRAFLSTLIASLFSFTALAQPGSLDPTFNPVGVAGPDQTVLSSAELPNGKILIGGYFTAYKAVPQRSMALINPDGSLDPAFQTGTGVRQSANLTYPTAVGQIVLRNDGKFWVGGLFDQYNGSAVPEGFMRVHPDGRLDTSFHAPLANTTYMKVLQYYPDGKTLLHIMTGSGGNPTVSRIMRLKANDQIDSSFNFTTPVYSLNTTGSEYFALPDGKILVYGNFTTVNGVPRNGLARLLADGSVDLTFNPNVETRIQFGTTRYVLRGFAIQPDGKVLIGGQIATVDGVPSKQIARLNIDGSRDASFNPPQIGDDQFTYVWKIALQPDGKIIVGGDWANIGSQHWEGLVRLNANGTQDMSFQVGSEGLIWQVDHLNLLSNGKLLVGGGHFGYHDYASQHISLVGTDGTPDPNFNWENGADANVTSLSMQTDGSVIVGGLFTRMSGTPAGRIARMKPDGNLDYYFGFRVGKGFNGAVNATAVQADGKILVGGDFTSFDGTTRTRLARLNTGGTLDNTFNTAAGFNFPVLAIAVQPNGNILVAGKFTTALGQSRTNIARLNADGTLDASFDPGANMSPGGEIRSIAVQPDGKIIVAGTIGYVGGAPANYIARLNSDGTRDASFATTGTGFGAEINSVALQADGKIIAGGFFTQYNGISTGRLVRLTATGALDAAFIAANGPTGTVNKVLVQPDGKILASGFIGNVLGQNRGPVVRFNSDGTLDNFSTANGPNTQVLDMALQSNGHIIVGGVFSTVGGVTRNRIARITGVDVVSAVSNIVSDASLSIYPNPARNVITIRSDSRGVQQLRVITPDGTVLATKSFTGITTIDTRRFPAASYFVEVSDSRGGKRTVKQVVKL